MYIVNNFYIGLYYIIFISYKYKWIITETKVPETKVTETK